MGQQECRDIATWGENVELRWRVEGGVEVPEELGYEVVVWDRYQEPLDSSQALGIHSIIDKNQISVNGRFVLRQSNAVTRKDFTYFWGVLLVQREPYERLKLLSPTYCRFKIDRSLN